MSSCIIVAPQRSDSLLKSHSIQYYAALVNVFKPLMYLRDTSREASDKVREILLRYAHQGLDLVVEYHSLYGAFYQSPLQLFCLVHLCDTVVSHDAHGASTAKVIRFCIENLQEAKAGYPLAGPLQRMFATAVGEYNIAIPQDLERLVGPIYQYQLDDLLNACTRPSYQAPVAQLRPNMSPSLAQDFMDEWHEAGDEKKQVEIKGPATTSVAPRSMNINELLNG